MNHFCSARVLDADVSGEKGLRRRISIAGDEKFLGGISSATTTTGYIQKLLSGNDLQYRGAVSRLITRLEIRQQLA